MRKGRGKERLTTRALGVCDDGNAESGRCGGARAARERARARRVLVCASRYAVALVHVKGGSAAAGLRVHERERATGERECCVASG